MDQTSIKRIEEIAEGKDDPFISEGKFITLNMSSAYPPNKGTYVKKQEMLLSWCRVHWDSTFKKSLVSGNSLYYHECCFCFSRRGFLKHSGHPTLQTSSVLKMPSFKEIQSAEDLCQWLVKKMESRMAYGNPDAFPSINKFHTDNEFCDESSGLLEQLQELKNQCSRLKFESLATSNTMDQLRAENSILQASAKNWHTKFQMLAEKTHEDEILEKKVSQGQDTSEFVFLN